jgi:hypothetical protein
VQTTQEFVHANIGKLWVRVIELQHENDALRGQLAEAHQRLAEVTADATGKGD